MPELPEVEILKNQLSPKSINRIFDNIIVRNNRLRQVITEDFSKKLIKNNILSLKRRSKYIIFELSGDFNLIIHLGMTGNLTFKDPDYLATKHDHIIFHFNDGENIMVYNDIRRFGLMKIVEKTEMSSNELFKNLGPEPLTQDFNFEYLRDRFKKSKSNIKNALMDNNIVVGIGNIYANEVLFKSKILPDRICMDLSEDEIKLIIENSIIILNKAINLGGSSFKNYIHADESKGSFQNEFEIYGRAGENCVICQNIIEKIKIGGRSSFYCQTCQK